MSELLQACDYSNSVSEQRLTAILFRNIKRDPECLNQCNAHGTTPLHMAVLSFKSRIVQLLIRFNADTNLTNNKQETPLHWAVKCGHFRIVEDLVNAKSDVNAKDSEGNTPLHWAAKGGFCDITNLLLDQRASPFAINLHDEQPCDMFVPESNIELYKLLA